MSGSLAQVEQYLDEELPRPPALHPQRAAAGDQPHVVIVIDDGE